MSVIQHEPTPHYFLNVWSIHNYDAIWSCLPKGLQHSSVRVTNIAEVRTNAVKQIHQKNSTTAKTNQEKELLVNEPPAAFDQQAQRSKKGKQKAVTKPTQPTPPSAVVLPSSSSTQCNQPPTSVHFSSSVSTLAQYAEPGPSSLVTVQAPLPLAISPYSPATSSMSMSMSSYPAPVPHPSSLYHHPPVTPSWHFQQTQLYQHHSPLDFHQGQYDAALHQVPILQQNPLPLQGHHLQVPQYQSQAQVFSDVHASQRNDMHHPLLPYAIHPSAQQGYDYNPDDFNLP